MPDIMKDYEHLNSWDENKLLIRQMELKATAPNGNYGQLSDETLQELLAIGRVLRKRTTAPTAKSAAGKRAPAPSLDAL